MWFADLRRSKLAVQKVGQTAIFPASLSFRIAATSRPMISRSITQQHKVDFP